MDERRSAPRKKEDLIIYARKTMPDGKIKIFQIFTSDISKTGAFLRTDQLHLFDIGEEIEILVDDGSDRYYEGRTRIVRSARIISRNDEQEDSGFGIVFIEPDEILSAMLEKHLD